MENSSVKSNLNTKNIPAIIMLSAGLIAAAVMYIKHYALKDMLLILLGVFLLFYIIGRLVKKMLDTFGMQIEQARIEEEERMRLLEEEMRQNADGAVIAKD